MNDNEIDGPFKVYTGVTKHDYARELEGALYRMASEWPGLSDNPVFQEVLEHISDNYPSEEDAGDWWAES